MVGPIDSQIMCIVGARPNFMKIAPIMAALRANPNPISACLVHTGQHYDEKMKDAFFSQLGIPEPNIDLEVGSASHAVQTAEIMKRFESVLDEQKPEAVLVVGDVNSTIACALVASKKSVPVIHVEAGLRSYDRTMPEEINRVLTDQISDLLFTTEHCAKDNLLKEGISEERIHFVGNVMIDTMRHNLSRVIKPEKTISKFNDSDVFLSSPNGYALLTLHRPSNVDNPESLEAILSTFAEISKDIPIVFPCHPRTESRIKSIGLANIIENERILVTEPLGYLEMLGLMSNAHLVLTDSGGIQEETTVLGIPCITLRENTERPITIEQGTNVLVGSNKEKILTAVSRALEPGNNTVSIPEYWDGKAAERIKTVLANWL